MPSLRMFSAVWFQDMILWMPLIKKMELSNTRPISGNALHIPFIATPQDRPGVFAVQ
jgi:hypothetical protein